MQRSARLMGAVTPDGLFGDWQELDNKIEAFRLFQFADRELQLPAGYRPSGQIAARSPGGETFHTIWVLEGVGHMAGLGSSLTVRGLLTEGEAGSQPESALVPLHAGMGTALAESVLSRPASDLRGAIHEFLDLCRANSSPGWFDNAVEPGLLLICVRGPERRRGDVVPANPRDQFQPR